MRKFLRICLLFILIAAAYSACQRASEENSVDTDLVAFEADSVQQLYTAKRDSVDWAWQQYAREEEEKLSDLKRLLQEISYTEAYDQARYDSLFAQVQALEQAMLTPEAMSSSQIDRYDAEINQLKAAVTDFAAQHPDFERYPLMSQLVDSVNLRDQRILFHRVTYDNYARDYNSFILPARQYPVEVDTTLRPLFQLED